MTSYPSILLVLLVYQKEQWISENIFIGIHSQLILLNHLRISHLSHMPIYCVPNGYPNNELNRFVIIKMIIFDNTHRGTYTLEIYLVAVHIMDGTVL